MSSLNRFLFTLVAVAAIAAAALAGSSPVGTWKGRVVIDMTKVPQVTNPQAKQQIEKQLAQMRGVVVTLKLNANKTFSVNVTGLPANAKGDTSDSGTWSQSGKMLTLTSNKKDAQGRHASKSMTESADGKTWTLEQSPVANVVFHRQ